MAPLIYIKLVGGLGNQMFQYAAGRALADRLGGDVVLDAQWYERDGSSLDTARSLGVFDFNIQARTCDWYDKLYLKGSANLRRAVGKLRLAARCPSWCIETYQERGAFFNEDLLKINKSVYLVGYWQSEKYFDAIEHVIRREFVPKDERSEILNPWLKLVRDSASVAVHVRRGDYVSSQIANQFHGVCELSYYEEAMLHLSSRLDNPVFFVFSDDIAWCKENLTMFRNVVYVEDEGLRDIDEMMLMASCSHNVIANSSFSWWGAWLNDSPHKIVIAPKEWFQAEVPTKDLVPKSWVRM